MAVLTASAISKQRKLPISGKSACQEFTRKLKEITSVQGYEIAAFGLFCMSVNFALHAI